MIIELGTKHCQVIENSCVHKLVNWSLVYHKFQLRGHKCCLDSEIRNASFDLCHLEGKKFLSPQLCLPTLSIAGRKQGQSQG